MASPVRTVKLTSCWLDHGDHSGHGWSMPGRVRFIARVLAWSRSGFSLRSGGLNNMSATCPLFEDWEWHVVCQRVRRVHQFMLWGIWAMAFLGLFGLSSVLCAYGSASFASIHLVVYKAWVTSVCLLLDTPSGRRSVGALPL